MHKYAYTYIYTCMYMHTYTLTYTHAYIYIYTCQYTYTHAHKYTHTYNMYICTHASKSETMTRQRLRRKPNLTPQSSTLLPVRCNPEGDHPSWPQPNCPCTRNDRLAHNKHNQQQLITPTRQRTAQTTTAHLHWCAADPPSSWPAQAARHGGYPPKRGYVSAILAVVLGDKFFGSQGDLIIRTCQPRRCTPVHKHCELFLPVSSSALIMMIAFVTIKSGLVPWIEGLRAQIYYCRFEIIGDFAFTSFALLF